MVDSHAVRALLGPAWPEAELRALGSVTSTNDIAWAWAEAGCPAWTTFFAEEQVRGRGRFGRRWVCPRRRGLLMSLVLRPEPDVVRPTHLIAVGALAVAEAIEATCGLAAGLEWPNDVTVRGRKVAGVLVERRSERASPCVLGIGVNVNTRPEEFAPELREVATSLAAEAGREFSRERLAANVLRGLAERYRQVAAGRCDQVAKAWLRRCRLVGLAARVQCDGARFHGTIKAVDPFGDIELELAGGTSRGFPAEKATLEVEGRS